METIAVYWEPVIKTYGIVKTTGLTLVSFPLEAGQSDPRVEGYLAAAGRQGNMRIVFAPPADDGGIRLHMLLDGPPPPDDGTAPPGLRIDFPVEMLYLQGPHFGDRYGIAEAAVGALATAGVPLRAMACAGASVHLIVPEGAADPAGRALARSFSSPAAESG